QLADAGRMHAGRIGVARDLDASVGGEVRNETVVRDVRVESIGPVGLDGVDDPRAVLDAPLAERDRGLARDLAPDLAGVGAEPLAAVLVVKEALSAEPRPSERIEEIAPPPEVGEILRQVAARLG